MLRRIVVVGRVFIFIFASQFYFWWMYSRLIGFKLWRAIARLKFYEWKLSSYDSSKNTHAHTRVYVRFHSWFHRCCCRLPLPSSLLCSLWMSSIVFTSNRIDNLLWRDECWFFSLFYFKFLGTAKPFPLKLNANIWFEYIHQNVLLCAGS